MFMTQTIFAFFFSFSWELKLYFGKSERSIFVNWLIYIYVLTKILDRTYFLKLYENVWGFLDDSVGKESACNVGEAGDVGSIHGSGRSPGGGHGNPLQYSCLRIPWTEGPGGLQFTALQRVGHDWSDRGCMHASNI